METDQRNMRYWRKDECRQWFPPIAETSFLWLRFMARSNWSKGYWVHHPRTNYLNFEAVEKGELTLHHEGMIYKIPAGSAVLIPPGESKLSAESAGGCRKYSFGISGLILNNNLTRMKLDKVNILHDFRNPEFELLHASLWKMSEEKQLEKFWEYCAKLYQLLLQLSHHCSMPHPYPKELQQAISFISQHFSLQLSLSDICVHAHCGRSTLHGQFKHYINLSPIQYLTTIRMKSAASLLENTSLSIKEISQKCGYRNQLYFSNTFRNYYNRSPREYRKSFFRGVTHRTMELS